MDNGRVGREAPETPLNPPQPDGLDLARQLAGEEAHADQDGALDVSEVDDLGSIGSVERYEGELEAGVNPDLPSDQESIDDLTARELRAGETGDAFVAAEEGETWVPPTDPPVIPDRADPQGAQVAAGFGTTSMADPFDADHPGSALPPDDEVSARVREALAADARTSRLADRVEVETSAGTAVLRGAIDDVDDSDLLGEVVSSVAGVRDVRDETRIPG